MQTAPVAWGDTGLRPAVSVSTQSAPEGIRTPNLLIRSQMLYPLSYGCVVPSRGGTKSYLSASGPPPRNRARPGLHERWASAPPARTRRSAHAAYAIGLQEPLRSIDSYGGVVKVLQETDKGSSYFLRPGRGVSRLTAGAPPSGEAGSRRRVP